MRNRNYAILLLVDLLIVSLFLQYGFFVKAPLDVFVGIDVAYADLPEIKRLIDEISS